MLLIGSDISDACGVLKITKTPTYQDTLMGHERYKFTGTYYISTSSTSYSRTGNSLGTVQSTNASAYPNNNVSGSYYYVRR